MRQVYVENSTIKLFIDSLCEIMHDEPQRIKENGDQFIDSQTNLSFSIEKDKWILHIPGGKFFKLHEDQVNKLTEALNDRENLILIEKHKELFNDENIYKIFTNIQKARDESQMVEDAYQNLLTVYALNMDGDTNVS